MNISTLSTQSATRSLVPAVSAPVAPVAPVYVSPFKSLLERGRWFALAAILLWAVAAFVMLRSTDVVTRVVGHDTSVSITSAEKMRSQLADANGNLANMLLIWEDSSGVFAQAYRKDVADAGNSLVAAARNITYPEEVPPITTIARDLNEYERLVGMAQGLAQGHGHGVGEDPDSIPAGLKAASLMRVSILPAAAELDKVNMAQLTAAYDSNSRTRAILFLFMSLMLVAVAGVLGALQLASFRRTHRLLNFGLLAASAIVLIASIWFFIAAAVAERAVYVAKVQAFDSIYALSNLRAVANEANSAESFWLLSYDNPADRREQADIFDAKAREVVKLLNDELANITFPGEEKAARATLANWNNYIQIDLKIRRLQTEGHRAEALALDVGRAAGQSNYVFDRFSEALDKTVKINQDQFDAAIARSESTINIWLYALIVLSWALASAAVWFGIDQRLREYEF